MYYLDLQKPVWLKNSDPQVIQPAGFPQINLFWPTSDPDSCSALNWDGRSPICGGGVGGAYLYLPIPIFFQLIYLLSTLYPPIPFPQFPGCAGDQPWLFMLGYGWGMRRRLQDSSKLITFGVMKSGNSVWYWLSHSIFHSANKIPSIFIYSIWMTTNTSVFLLWAIMISMSCYAIILFLSCKNLHLHFTYAHYKIKFPTVSEHGLWQA
jgi:hypothetical protein